MTIEAPIDEITDTETEPVEQIDATTDESVDDAETFPRDYVEKLRSESAKYRQRASDRDAVAKRLHAALVAATGRLADPDDLPFEDAHLDAPEALTAALDALLDRKPHLASRRPVGSIGQGVSATAPSVDLGGILRSNAS